jgi:predicted ATP-dependent endonuclease of OLD family
LSGKVVSRISFENSARSWFDKRYEGDEALESEFTNLLQQVIDFFKMIITAEFKNTDLVKASRTVPTIKDVISLIPGETRQGKDKRVQGYKLEWSPLLRTLDPIINATETHWKYMCEIVAKYKTSDDDESDKDWFDLSYLGRINSLLREELFIENAYQLTGEVFCAAELADLEEYSLNDSKYYPKLVRLFLTDNHQRKLEIEDVGSGIGYVLPVLASLVHDDISLIQQPELHLHPRLQSQLGEAIIRAVENKKYYRAFTIIETHSEHVLLKVMRLMRNSESRKDDSIKPITYDRVSVLYFEPLPSGETQVKRLRLAPDGQLIDRWPGGFFNERFKDIFDE